MFNFGKSLIALTILTFAALSISPSSAEARKRQSEIRTPSDHLADNWNAAFYFPFLEKLAKLPSERSAVSGAEQARCEKFYEDIDLKKSIKIVLGLGYYDASEGKPFTFQYRDDSTGALMKPDFGMNATIDIAYLRMYSKMFTRKCRGKLQVCGFSEKSPGVFQKFVKNDSGKKISATIEMRNSSVTPLASANTGEFASEQLAKSEATTRWFFSSIPSADLVIYNGHSRKGGGPDFSPPKLLSNLHVNYKYYADNEPGFNRLLNALSATSKPKALMMMSCTSTPLFFPRIAKVAPFTSFTGTDAVIAGDIPTKGALAGIDSLLRFQCESGFNRALQTTPEIQQHLTRFEFQ